jgi:hypothetical protein
VAGLRRAAEHYERPVELGSLEISITPPEPIDQATADAYAELGVHQLILRVPRSAEVAVIEHFIYEQAAALFGTA